MRLAILESGVIVATKWLENTALAIDSFKIKLFKAASGYEFLIWRSWTQLSGPKFL